MEGGAIPHPKTRAKDGRLKKKNGVITGEEGEGTGETLENRVVGGQMVRRIKGQGDGRGLEEERLVVGEETGGRGTLYLEMGEAEGEATLMRRAPPGVIWMKGELSEEVGEGEMWVEANPTRTGGVQSPTQLQQHRYQTAKWHQ